MSWVPVVLTRRGVFAVTGMTLASACAAPAGSGRSPGSLPPAAADEVRDRALAAETDLVARYDAALALPAVAADSALTARLTKIRDEHVAHAAAVKDGYQGSGSPPASGSPSSASAPSAPSAPSTPSSPSASSSPPSSPAPTTPATPAPDAKTAVAALVKAEQDAAAARTADILAADGATAMLLASVAASESGHAALLLGGAA